MKYFYCIIITFLFLDCQKQVTDKNINCDLLQQGLINNNVNDISASLGGLLNAFYSEENLKQLAESISKSCDVSAQLDCFDCIKTNPPQSEMYLSYLSNGASTTKTLDLTITTNNKIKLVSLE